MKFIVLGLAVSAQSLPFDTSVALNVSYSGCNCKQCVYKESKGTWDNCKCPSNWEEDCKHQDFPGYCVWNHAPSGIWDCSQSLQSAPQEEDHQNSDLEEFSWDEDTNKFDTNLALNVSSSECHCEKCVYKEDAGIWSNCKCPSNWEENCKHQDFPGYCTWDHEPSGIWDCSYESGRRRRGSSLQSAPQEEDHQNSELVV